MQVCELCYLQNNQLFLFLMAFLLGVLSSSVLSGSVVVSLSHSTQLPCPPYLCAHGYSVMMAKS